MTRNKKIRAAQDTYLFHPSWRSIGRMRMQCEVCGEVVRFGREQDAHSTHPRFTKTLTSR